MNQPTAAALLKPVWTETLTKEQILQKWLDAKKVLDDAKDLEMQMRNAVVAAFPFTEGAKEGTHRVDLANGWQLKVVLKQNYNLNKDTDKALTAYENAGATDVEKALRADLTERLVKWKPTLSISEYRNLDAAALKALEPVLTITDGSPALELIEPKTK